MTQNRRLGIFAKALIICFSVYCLFWNLGRSELAEWDETRYGQNAFEMLKSGDYVNYSFNGQLDLWNAKPPLQVWLITVSYRIFGFNEFGLRFPSAVGGSVALLMIFFLCRLFFSTELAWLGVLIAATSHGLIGGHTSRTGEMDAWLVALLTGFTFFFLRSELRSRRNDLYLAGLFLGLAFYAKGVTVVFVFPGVLAFLLMRGRFKSFFKQKEALMGLALFLAFPLSWFSLVSIFGKTDTSHAYQGSNSFYVMLLFDAWARFRGTMNAEPDPFDPFYLPRAFDLRFSPWWYLILAYAGLMGTSWSKVKANLRAGKAKFVGALTGGSSLEMGRQAILVSALFGLPICLLLFVSRHKLEWYVAPLTPFFVLLTLGMVQFLNPVRPRLARSLMALGVCIGVGNQIRTISFNPYTGFVRDFMYAHRGELAHVQEISTNRPWRQVERLYLTWFSPARLIEPPSAPYLGADGLEWSCESPEKCHIEEVLNQ